ncbi:MAG: hypothetical protein Rhims3KO_18320 [Hyphomicrobiales bacterium]
MPAPFFLAQSSTLKHRLLGSASAAVITLAMSMAAPTDAVAQEITGPDDAATNLVVGTITSGTTGGQFGVIDTGNFSHFVSFSSITLTHDETIRITDTNADLAADADRVISYDLQIDEAATATLLFGEDADGSVTDSARQNAAGLTIYTDLEGVGGGHGGTLSISVADDLAENGSAFIVYDSTNLTDINITGGAATNGPHAAAGGDITAYFGGRADASFALSATLDVTGGDAALANAGGAAHVTIAGSLTLQDATTIAGGTGAAATTGTAAATGGAATLVTNPDSPFWEGTPETFAAISVFGGNGTDGLNDDVTAPGGDGGAAHLHLGLGGYFTAGLDVVGGDGGIGGNDTDADAPNTGANGGDGGVGGNDTDVDAPNAGANGGDGGMATALIDAGAVIELNGALAVENGTTGANGTGITPGTGGTGGTAMLTVDGTLILAEGVTGGANAGTITLGNSGTIRFQLDADETSAGVIYEGGGSLSFSGGDHTVAFNTINGAGTIGAVTELGAMTFSDGADASFAATVNVHDINLGEGSLATFAANTSISGDVAGTGTMQANTADTVLLFDGTTAQFVHSDIQFGAAAEGIVRTANLAGVTFIGAIGGETRAQSVDIGANNAVTFNGVVTTDRFSVQGDGTSLNFDAEGANQVIIGAGGAGTLTLDDGTINLGSQVGSGDTVFNIEAGALALPEFVVNSVGGVTVNLASNFTDGAIALIDTNAQSFNGDQASLFAVTDTALTDFTVQAREGAADILEITAAARSTADTATFLGVSEQQANSLRQASASARATNDTVTQNRMTEVLNTAPSESQTEILTELDTSPNIVASLYKTMAQYVHAVGETVILALHSPPTVTVLRPPPTPTGFNGGDVQTYSPQTPSHLNAFWGEAYGGFADADGSSSGSGYDANYGGLVVGVDGMIGEDITLGAFANYGVSAVDGEGAANLQIDASTYGAGLYAGYVGQGFYIDGIASYALSSNELSRTALGQTISADFDTSQFNVSLSGGAPIEVSSNVFITPNASLTWNHSDSESYTETGSMGLSQHVNPDASSSLTGTIGARIHAVHESFGNTGTTFVPELRLAMVGDLIDDDATATVNYVGGGTAYQVTGTDTSDIGALVGFGLTLDNPYWSASLSYDAEIRSDLVSHTGRARISWSF